MGLTDALEGYNRLMRMCPACRKAAIDRAKRLEASCHAGKHVHPRTKGVLLEGPPE
jgi:hypothetical protein